MNIASILKLIATTNDCSVDYIEERLWEFRHLEGRQAIGLFFEVYPNGVAIFEDNAYDLRLAEDIQGLITALQYSLNLLF